MNVGVVGNPSYGDLQALLGRLLAAAPAHGFTLFTEQRLAELWPGQRPAVWGSAVQLDFLLTIGGDGTLLRGARLLNGAATPILGVNVGRVGFLATAPAQNLDSVLDAAARRAYTIEPRLAIVATVEDGAGALRTQPIALNDIVVHKGGVARVLRIRLSVDGEEVGAYSADGIIVATPTGSTAYSLSAGGPIVVPGVEAMVVTPIAAHTLAVRPLVVPATYRIVIEPMEGWSEDLLVSFDGQTGSALAPGESVDVRRADHRVCLIRLGGDGFFGRMRQKLHWGDLSGREESR